MNRRAEHLLRTAQRRFAGECPSVILIDGRSGSGKTLLSTSLARAFASTGADILPVEDLYPGWDGLDAGADAVAAALAAGVYRTYDWHLGAFSGKVDLDARRPLIVEGCGAIGRENLLAATKWGAGRVWAVWVECPEEVRRTRALRRDGEMFRPHWERWARQEEDRMARQWPVAYAHQIVHTGGSVHAGLRERG